MTDAYRWELIDTLRSATLADLLATVPEINQRTFIDAAQLLEDQADEIKRLSTENGRLTQALIDELAKPKARIIREDGK